MSPKESGQMSRRGLSQRVAQILSPQATQSLESPANAVIATTTPNLIDGKVSRRKVLKLFTAAALVFGGLNWLVSLPPPTSAQTPLPDESPSPKDTTIVQASDTAPNPDNLQIQRPPFIGGAKPEDPEEYEKSPKADFSRGKLKDALEKLYVVENVSWAPFCSEEPAAQASLDCTAVALSQLLRTRFNMLGCQFREGTPQNPTGNPNIDCQVLNPGYITGKARAVSLTVGGAMNVVIEHGICTNAIRPSYIEMIDPWLLDQEPNEAQKADAERFKGKILGKERIFLAGDGFVDFDWNRFKAYLLTNPMMIGIPLYSNCLDFVNEDVLPLKIPGSNATNFHAVEVVGFDDSADDGHGGHGVIIARFGPGTPPDPAKKGFVKIPYRYFNQAIADHESLVGYGITQVLPPDPIPGPTATATITPTPTLTPDYRFRLHLPAGLKNKAA